MPRYPSASPPPLNGESKRSLEETLDLLLEPIDPLFDGDDDPPPKHFPKNPTKRLTPKELLALFKAWEVEDEACKVAREVFERAETDFIRCKARRSEAARTILVQAGRGQYEYPAGSGRILMPWTAPGTRDGSRPQTFYLRDASKKRQRVE